MQELQQIYRRRHSTGFMKGHIHTIKCDITKITLPEQDN
jgi:hypothetical protein